MSRHVTRMTIYDSPLYDDEKIQDIIAKWPEHEREARAKGIPVLGSGVVFPVSEDEIREEPFVIPDHWVQLGALDFGWDHPTAAVHGAYDRDADVVHIVKCYRQKHGTPVIHAAALKPWGKDLRWAWPHDGYHHDKQSGMEIKEAYSRQGMKMLPMHSQFPDGTSGVEAGLMEMLDRFQTGRLKVFYHLNDWFEEYRTYHRQDGKPVKKHDDLMSATRYLIMSLRSARRVEATNQPTEVLVQREYNPHAW